MSLFSGAKSLKLKKVQSGSSPGDLVTPNGDREIRSVPRRISDDPGGLERMQRLHLDVMDGSEEN